MQSTSRCIRLINVDDHYVFISLYEKSRKKFNPHSLCSKKKFSRLQSNSSWENEVMEEPLGADEIRLTYLSNNVKSFFGASVTWLI